MDPHVCGRSVSNVSDRSVREVVLLSITRSLDGPNSPLIIHPIAAWISRSTVSSPISSPKLFTVATDKLLVPPGFPNLGRRVNPSGCPKLPLVLRMCKGSLSSNELDWTNIPPTICSFSSVLDVGDSQFSFLLVIARPLNPLAIFSNPWVTQGHAPVASVWPSKSARRAYHLRPSRLPPLASGSSIANT